MAVGETTISFEKSEHKTGESTSHDYSITSHIMAVFGFTSLHDGITISFLSMYGMYI